MHAQPELGSRVLTKKSQRSKVIGLQMLVSRHLQSHPPPALAVEGLRSYNGPDRRHGWTSPRSGRRPRAPPVKIQPRLRLLPSLQRPIGHSSPRWPLWRSLLLRRAKKRSRSEPRSLRPKAPRPLWRRPPDARVLAIRSRLRPPRHPRRLGPLSLGLTSLLHRSGRCGWKNCSFSP